MVYVNYIGVVEGHSGFLLQHLLEKPKEVTGQPNIFKKKLEEKGWLYIFYIIIQRYYYKAFNFVLGGGKMIRVIQ